MFRYLSPGSESVWEGRGSMVLLENVSREVPRALRIRKQNQFDFISLCVSFSFLRISGNVWAQSSNAMPASLLLDSITMVMYCHPLPLWTPKDHAFLSRLRHSVCCGNRLETEQEWANSLFCAYWYQVPISHKLDHVENVWRNRETSVNPCLQRHAGPLHHRCQYDWAV